MSKCMLSILALLLTNLISFSSLTTVFADEKKQVKQTETVDIAPKVLGDVHAKEPTFIALPPGAVARFGRGGGSDVAVSPDGDLVAVVSNIGVWLYSAYTDEFLSLLASKGENIPSTAAFSPDGTQIAIGYRNGPARLWRIFSESTETELPAFLHGGPATRVTFSPDGKLLATSGWNNEAILWDVDTRTVRFTFKHEDAVRTVLFSPDGRRLATGSLDATAKLWDLETGKQFRSFAHPDYRRPLAFPSGHTEIYNEGGIRCIAFSPDGKFLATGGLHRDRDVKLWDIEQGKQRWSITFEASAKSITFSPDGRYIATHFTADVVHVLRIEDGTAVPFDLDREKWIGRNERKPPAEHTSEGVRVNFSPNGKHLINLGANNTIRVRDIETGVEVKTLVGTNGYTKTIGLSPEGEYLGICIRHEDAVELWGEETIARFPHEIRVMTAEISNDGTLLATGGRDNKVKLYDVETEKLHHTLSGHIGPIQALAFSPDGTLLVSSGGTNWEELAGDDGITYTFSSRESVVDKTAKVWDVATGENIATFEHLGAVRAIAFSPDGTLLATSAGRTDIRSTKTWQDITTLSTVNATSLTFSPDGTRIAVGMSGRQPTVQIWDIATRKPIATFIGHKRDIQSLAFSPDSRLLASGGSDGVIYLWKVTPDG
ncbi:hypothetical protein F4Z99_16810 [Candidatus Poribacteria bacterium]|nr:hypothetical protein [Candidatus Poribacteria bacterium]MYA98947.1 hypothetical protein [Candidatus Poribacteria bacterium]